MRCANPGGRPTTTRSSTRCSTARASCCAASSAGGAAGRRLRRCCARAARERRHRAARARRRGRARRRDDRRSRSRPPARSPRPASTCATATSTTSSSCCASSPTRSCSRATASSRRARCADLGVYVPGVGDVALEHALAGHDPARPTVGICFYRSHRLTGNTAFVDALCARDRGGRRATRSRCGATRCGATRDGRVPALELLDGRVDALLTTMLATGGSGAPRDAARASASWQTGRRRSPRSTCRCIQAVCATGSRAAWLRVGLGPDAARRRDAGRDPRVRRAPARRRRSRSRSATRRLAVGVAVRATCPTPSAARASRGWRCATRGCARCRRRAAGRDAAHRASRPSTRGSAWRSGSTRRRARCGCSTRSRADGMRSSGRSRDGDELMHALIAAGGHDPEFLTDDQLAAAPLRLPVARLPGLVRDAAGVAARRRSRSAGARRRATATSTATTS